MASTYLTRTNGTSTEQKIFTFSAWVKRSAISTSGDKALMAEYTDGNNRMKLQFKDDDFFEVYQVDGGNVRTQVKTNRKFRDCSAWYHIVVACDNTQGTNTNRVKIYVNGEQETSFSIATYPYSSTIPNLNANSKTITIGNDDIGGSYFDGSMSHIHFIDGTAYDASAFGETDATTGEWVGKTSPSVTYGTNGFFILKDGNGITDQSGEGNDFTLGGGTLTDLKDNPDNTFATLNPLQRNSTAAYNNTLSIGNTRQTTMSIAGVYTPSPSTLGMTSGKIYAEMKVNTMPANCFVGIDGDASYTVRQGINFGSSPYGYAYAQWGGKYHDDVSVAGAGATFGAGDIIGIAVDLDNNKIYFSKNGTWQNSGDPTSGATGTGAFYTIEAASSTTEGAYFFESSNNDADGNAIFDWNFGNGYFGTTAVSSAGTNASDNGIFEYDVPTGYTALSTKGLNL